MPLTVAIPATAGTLVYVVDAELKVPGPEATDNVMLSVELVPVVMTLPLASSTATLKFVNADPAVPVSGADT